MSVAGAADDWTELLEKMLPTMLRLVVDVWNELPKPFTDNKEDAITEILCRALRKSKIARDLPFYIEIQRIELDPAPSEELGRLDIAFLPTGLPGAPDETIYFCLECKRLNAIVNGKKRPGGSEYVANGMMRFVSGQYANAVRHGGMLGYVLDGDVVGATANVESNVSSQHVSLCMEPPGVLQPSSVGAEIPTARESRHSRAGQSVKFCIHHVFVDALTAGA